MKLSVINMGVHPEKYCSCGNPAHIGLADMNPSGARGYIYKDHICSQCALRLISDLSHAIRPERGMSRDELQTKNARRHNARRHDGVACSPSCRGHQSHPCEKCGRQWPVLR